MKGSEGDDDDRLMSGWSVAGHGHNILCNLVNKYLQNMKMNHICTNVNKSTIISSQAAN